MMNSIRVGWIISLLIISFSGQAQIFQFKEYSPFGIEPVNFQDNTRFAFKYMFEDMDADGDLDLFLFGLDEMDTVSTNSDLQNIRYFIEVQENIGDKWNPDFKSREKRFENFNYASGNSFFLPSIGDLNNDGKPDMVISAYANTEFIQELRFDFQTENFQFDTHYGSEYELYSFSPGSIFIPELIDLDMDGDLDLLLSGGSHAISEESEQINIQLYAKNIGSASQPDFLGWFANPYNLQIDSVPAFICGGDLDLDGDMDLLGVAEKDTLQSLIYFENNPGADQKPYFTSTNMDGFGLPVPTSGEESFYFPSPVDLDGDGDTDLILPYIHLDTLGGTEGNYELDTVFHLFYYENTLCDPQHEYIDEFICQGDTITIEGESYFEAGCWDIEKTGVDGCIQVMHIKLEMLAEIETELVQEGKVLKAFNSEYYTYQWFDCDSGEDQEGETSFLFEPDYSGHFGVVITDEFGCTANSDCVYVDITGLKTIKDDSDFVLAPNPTTGELTIFANPGIQISGIEVFNRVGKRVKVIDPTKLKQIDLNTFENGIYFMKITTSENRVLVKQFLLIDHLKK